MTVANREEEDACTVYTAASAQRTALILTEPDDDFRIGVRLFVVAAARRREIQQVD